MIKNTLVKNIVSADARGRITLSPKWAHSQFSVVENERGELLLTPVVTIPKQEAWLFANKEALDLVRQGLEESGRGETVYLGSFAEFADIEID